MTYKELIYMYDNNKKFLDEMLEKINSMPISENKKDENINRIHDWVMLSLENEEIEEDWDEEDFDFSCLSVNTLGKCIEQRIIEWQKYYEDKNNFPEDEWPIFKNNINIMEYGRTKIHNACYNGDINLLKDLLSNDQIDLNIKDNGGNTAYELAVMQENYECAELILKSLS